MTVQIAVRLDDELIERVDELVAAPGGPATRTDAIRRAVRRYVDELQREAVTRQLVEGYARTPEGGSDEWGDTMPSTAGTRAVLRQLDDEEGDRAQQG